MAVVLFCLLWNPAIGPIFLLSKPKRKVTKMSVLNGNIRMGFLGRAIAVFGAASAAAAAVESNRAPRERDLRTLGIDPKAFKNLRNS